ncbi:hypothetical protein [Azorhizobium sp. AG788]|uniref:hypothetical protein n=1 Tax=Azorhizobium sp. AG788 TaxID=2183897 RepID=UPI0031398A04
MTTTETTLSRLLAAAGALLRAAVPAASPVMAGGASLNQADAPRAAFGGQKREQDAVEPAIASFPRGL